jgi:hypothetical protein
VTLAVCFFALHRTVSIRPTDDDSAPSTVRIWSLPASWLFIAFGFFNIGIETGLGGWLTSYSDSLKQIGQGGINWRGRVLRVPGSRRGLASDNLAAAFGERPYLDRAR